MNSVRRIPSRFFSVGNLSFSLLCVLSLSLLLPLIYLLLNSEPAHWPEFWERGPWRRALSFTVRQSFYSSLLSLALAVPGAWLLSHRRFWGCRILEKISTLAFFVPSVALIIGFVLVFGRKGLFNQLLRWLPTSEPLQTDLLYSFGMILLAHVFYNLAVPLQLVKTAWRKIPRSLQEEAAISGASAWQYFRYVSLPLLGPSLIASFSLVFVFCFSSFSLILGLGNFESTSLEVEIYRFFRRDMGFREAGFGVVLQLFFLSLFTLSADFLIRKSAQSPGTLSAVEEIPLRQLSRRAHFCWIAVYLLPLWLFFALPFLAILKESFSYSGGDNPHFDLHWYHEVLYREFRALADGKVPQLLKALGTSLVLALNTGFFVSTMTFLLAKYSSVLGRSPNWRTRYKNTVLQFLTQLPLLISPVALSGALIVSMTLFYGDFSAGNFFRLGALQLVHISLALPLCFRLIYPLVLQFDREILDSARLEGAGAWSRFYWLEWPLLSRALHSCFLLALVISLGEIHAGLVLDNSQLQTIPLLIYRALTRYRYTEGSVLVVFLCLLMMGLFLLCRFSALRVGFNAEYPLKGIRADY